MSHVSIRVPWHDNKWNGCYCKNPAGNTYCTILPNIARIRKDPANEPTDRDWLKCAQNTRPACAGENGGFMNTSVYSRTFTHVYSSHANSKHSRLLPTTVEIPEYTAIGVPYAYLTKDSQEALQEHHPEFRIDEQASFNSAWIYGSERQTDILNWFRSNLSDGESLCVFYCKNGTPLDDEGRRLIIGLGEITKIHPLCTYDTSADYTYPLWEIFFEHSIRQNLRESRGFLLPYQEYLALEDEYIFSKTGLSKDEALDQIKISQEAFNNNDRILQELSYGCEMVSNQSFLLILLAARDAVEAVIRHGIVGGDWANQLRWINQSISKVKSLIQPFPSFAEALKAIGFEYAYLIEQDLRKAGCGKKDDPWIYLDNLLTGSLQVDESLYTRDLSLYSSHWKNLSEASKQLLHLLSRFELSWEVIKRYYHDTERYTVIIENPYLIVEDACRDKRTDVTTSTIDMGIMKDPEIQGEFVPESPSVVETVLDQRRLRALTVELLTGSLQDGDTLLSIPEIEENLARHLKQDDNALLPIGYIQTVRPFFSEVMCYLPDEAPKSVQLKEYFNIEGYLRKLLIRRGKRDVMVPLTEDWLKILKDSGNYKATDPRSVEATTQQARALEMMGRRRLSVLTGGAGTGKTTVVKSFLKSEQIQKEGVLLLAPTGKARVRLESMAHEFGIKAQTIAQFLLNLNRFDWETMQPKTSSGTAKYQDAQNVIIDEASMLTELDLYVLLNAIEQAHVKRIILIGDPYQLPPIGPGRPFSDLCNYLKAPKKEDEILKESITVLTAVVRTIDSGDSHLLTLAAWYGGDKPPKDADAIFDKIISGNLHGDLRVSTWNNEEDLKDVLLNALSGELGCPVGSLGENICQRLGLDNLKALRKKPDTLEALQLLSPVSNPAWGTVSLNSIIQAALPQANKEDQIEIGSSTIFSGDKVMQLQNMNLKGYPSGENQRIANGQIGFVESIRKSAKMKFCNVSFVGIPEDTIGFKASKKEDNPPLGLAYAITIHKSQGSDFETVIVVLPKNCRILSRELIYTAITRAKKRVILLVQENFSWLRAYTHVDKSVLALRNTNLFSYWVRDSKKKIPYVEGLIHTTKPNKNGEVLSVRSKSEVIIVNELITAGIEFEYERELSVNGVTYIPDFTFTTWDGERIIWEHLGMLGVPEYKRAWERKKRFYESIGYEEGRNLFTTEDRPDGSIHTTDAIDVIEKIKDELI